MLLSQVSKGSKTVHDDDLGLIDPDGAVSAVDDGGYYRKYYAHYGEPQPENRGAHGHAGIRIG